MPSRGDDPEDGFEAHHGGHAPMLGDDEESDEQETGDDDEVDEDDEEIVPVAIDDVELEEDDRIITGIENVDEVLGGGFPRVGASYMMSGSPGVGKSTLLLELLYALGAQGVKTAYVSNEMQPSLVALYASKKRLDLARRYRVAKEYRPVIFQSMDIDKTLQVFDDNDYELGVIDSLSACRSNSINGPMGGVAQMNYACESIVSRVQRKPRSPYDGAPPINILSIVHETKDGSSAGPNAVKHWFDASLSLDHVDLDTLDAADDQTEPTGLVRMRSPGKNRWASTMCKAYFKMTKKGLHPFDPGEKPKKPRARKSTLSLAG